MLVILLPRRCERRCWGLSPGGRTASHPTGGARGKLGLFPPRSARRAWQKVWRFRQRCLWHPHPDATRIQRSLTGQQTNEKPLRQLVSLCAQVAGEALICRIVESAFVLLSSLVGRLSRVVPRVDAPKSLHLDSQPDSSVPAYPVPTTARGTTRMATAHDVAAYILKERGSMSAMKLEKLVYYSQAWHLVWEDEPLFADRIEAWANGPVIPSLYKEHRGSFTVGQWSTGDPDRLSAKQRGTIDAVLGFYGDKEAFWLSELTHREAPWRDAREGFPPGERGSREIKKSSIAEFYGSLI